jgi:anti-sigma-K factor RskA
VNLNDYISSGILEAYVLGALSSEERVEVAAMVDRYPEVAAEVRELERTLYRYCEAFAVTPPADLSNKIWNSISGEADTAARGKTMPLLPAKAQTTFQWRNAAAVAVLIGSLAVNYMFWNNSQHEKQNALALQEQLNKMQTDQKQMADLLANYQNSKAMMADTAVQTIVMHTMVKGHPMAATMYWSKDKGDAFVALDALPAPPKGMQYQLWVIQNGKPVSMGMLPDNMANTPLMQKINMQVTNAEAFAISLEKRGGNPTPTTVYVLGKA